MLHIYSRRRDQGVVVDLTKLDNNQQSQLYQQEKIEFIRCRLSSGV